MKTAVKWRLLGWGSAVILLLLPAVAMIFTDSVNWTRFDFLVAAILLGVTGGLIELTAKVVNKDGLRRVISGGWLLLLLLVWLQLSVGLID